MKRLHIILIGLLLLSISKSFSKCSEPSTEPNNSHCSFWNCTPDQPFAVIPEHATSAPKIFSLDGVWTRIDGNNENANGMVIQINNGQGIILNAARTRLKKGDVKWKNIVATGSKTFKHQELGSNYKYYDGTMELSKYNELTVRVGTSGRGNAQIWERKTIDQKNGSGLSENQDQMVNVNQNPIAAVGPNGEELLIFPNRTYKTNGKVPDELTQSLFAYLQGGHIIMDVEFAPKGSGWAIATNRQVMARNIGGLFLNEASKTYEEGGYIVDFEFKQENWNTERAFVFLDQKGRISDNSSQSILDFNRREAIQVDPVDQESVKATKVKYTVSCDWLVVYEAHDMGVSGNALELCGNGDLAVWHKETGATPITVKLERNVVFSAGNRPFEGRMFSIEDYSPVKLGTGEGTALPEGKVEIMIDLNDFGGVSLEEFERNTWLNFEFFFIEKDIGNTFTDLFPITKRKVYLSEADIEPVRSLSSLFENETGGSQNVIRENVVRMRFKSDEIGVSFSLVREIIE